MMDIWRENIAVRFGAVDGSDRLTLDAAFGFFQEAAISHAANLGVGRDALAENKQGWILSRFSVFIERRPKYEETITVRSWPRGAEKLFAMRDYDILDTSGKAMARGRGAWLVLDTEKRRPLRAGPVMDKLPLNAGRNALLSGPRSLTSRENLSNSGERRAVYSDIDFYGHVNNVRYIQWIEDITPPELLNNAAQMRLDINYLSEIVPGEKVELFSAMIEDPPSAAEGDYPAAPMAAIAYEGRRADSKGQALFRAELRLGNHVS